MTTRRPLVTAACAAALIIPGALTAQTDTTRRDTTMTRTTGVTSDQRLRVQKRGEAGGTLDITARERARQDSINAAMQRQRDSVAMVERMRADSIAAVERARADSIARVNAEIEAARRDSIAREEALRAEEEARRQYYSRYRLGGNGWYIGVAGGASAPTGDLQSLGYNSGFNVNVPIGWHKENNLLGFRIDMNYNQFSGSTFTGNDGTVPLTLNNANPQVFSATANLTAQVPTPIRNVSLYGVGGGGLYHFREFGRQSALGGYLGEDVLREDQTVSSRASRNKFGAQVGAGLDWQVGTSSVFVESRLVNVFAGNEAVRFRDFLGERGTNLRWVPIVLGVKIR